MSLDRPAVAPPAKPCHARARVSAPGRLHLGFMDPAATLGRRFGSLGLVVDGFECVLSLQPAAADAVQVLDGTEVPGAADDARRASEALARLRTAAGSTSPLRLVLERRLPPHAGLGSGTQLALAIGRAFAALHGLSVSTPVLAHWLGRGLRSGVGIAGFDQGGLLLDGGPGADGRPAPLLARQPWPEDWRLLLVLDPAHQGLSGAQEKQAIAALQPLPQGAAADVCHQVLMRVLPGAAEADFALCAAGVARVQQVLGGHFAPAQGGSAYASAAVGRLLQQLASAAGPAHTAIGQSSWGPTGFALMPSAQQARHWVQQAHARGWVAAGLQLLTVSGRNHGARLELD